MGDSTRDLVDSTAAERILRAAATRTPAVGDRFGKFTLTSFLGSGSFGSVFRAEQDEPVRRRVAVKVLTGAERSSRAERRFAAERRALAALAHPGIAAILDGGISSDGTPWFAMELVEGQPIDAFCEATGMDARGCMALLRHACDAVDYAHRRGIIHRDLKPGHVIVRPEGNAFTVKVIDFGLAKLSGAQATDAEVAEDCPRASQDDPGPGSPDATAVGQALGTPAYMSPEAASLDPARIDARSDVYSLTAIAVRLLTGAPQRLAGEEEPAIARLAWERSRESEALSERLKAARVPRRRDLEAVLLRGLMRDPASRYQRPADLADELDRWLHGFPVRARPIPAAGRALWFARRHWIAASTLGVLAIGISMTTAWAIREAGIAHRRQADAEARTERMRMAVEPLLNTVQITQVAEDSVGVRRMLVQASEEVYGSSHPKTNSRRMMYAQTLRGARDFDGALAQLAKLLDVARDAGLDETSPAVQRIVGHIADTLRMKGDTAAARQLCETSVLLADRLGDGCDGNLQQARLALVCMLMEEGEWTRAVDEAFCAADALARCDPDALGQRTIATSLVADALMAAGRIEEGRRHLRDLQARVPELVSAGASLQGVMREWRAQEVLEQAERMHATDPGGAAMLRESEAIAVEGELRRSPPVVARLRSWRSCESGK